MKDGRWKKDAKRAGGHEDKRTRGAEYRVWSIEYRGSARIEDGRGHFFQVTGLGPRALGSSCPPVLETSVIRHRFSHRPVSGGGWQLRVAGSGMHRGRDVITITSVGGRTSGWSVILPGDTHAPRRTAVMAMTALPKAEISNTKGNRRPGYWRGYLGRAGSPSPPLSRSSSESPPTNGRFGKPSLPEVEPPHPIRFPVSPVSDLAR
jgi:hypothetical protein